MALPQSTRNASVIERRRKCAAVRIIRSSGPGHWHRGENKGGAPITLSAIQLRADGVNVRPDPPEYTTD